MNTMIIDKILEEDNVEDFKKHIYNYLKETPNVSIRNKDSVEASVLFDYTKRCVISKSYNIINYMIGRSKNIDDTEFMVKKLLFLSILDKEDLDGFFKFLFIFPVEVIDSAFDIFHGLDALKRKAEAIDSVDKYISYLRVRDDSQGIRLFLRRRL